jgi:hypothetical protein
MTQTWHTQSGESTWKLSKIWHKTQQLLGLLNNPGTYAPKS